MKELCKSVRLIPYMYNFKTAVAGEIFFVLLSIIFILLDTSSILLGSMYLMCGGAGIVQSVYTLLLAEQVASSPLRKTMDGSTQNLFMFLVNFGVYGICFFYALVKVCLDPAKSPNYANVMLAVAIGMVTISLYLSMSYKIFITGTIIFSCSYPIVYFIGLDWIRECRFRIPFSTATIIGGVIILLGNLITIFIRKILYKKIVSKYCGGAMLRKSMQ